MIPRVLTIASSDSGGGAGIQADLKAFARCGAHGTSAIVALTAQNTLGVTSIAEQSAEFVRDQMRAVLDDIGADAAKTGMLFSSAIIEAVADELAGRGLPLVVDPVMMASSGSRLLRADAVATLTGRLFPLATVVTPNLPEAQALTGLDTEDRAALAERLVSMGARAALVTGGHGITPADHLFDGRTHLAIPVPRHDIAATHGAGCTHSAALAAGLAAGLSLPDAARLAAAVASDAVAHGLAGLGSGDGPVHVLHSVVCGGATPLHPPRTGGLRPPVSPHGRTAQKPRSPPRCGAVRALWLRSSDSAKTALPVASPRTLMPFPKGNQVPPGNRVPAREPVGRAGRDHDRGNFSVRGNSSVYRPKKFPRSFTCQLR